MRGGYALVSGMEQDEGSDFAHGFAIGGDMLLARGPLGISAGIDHYNADEGVTAVSLEASYRFRLPRERAFWVAFGRTFVEHGDYGGADSVWAPSAGYSWPLGKRQLYVTARYHDAPRQPDPRFRPDDLNTTLLMLGIRSTDFLSW